MNEAVPANPPSAFVIRWLASHAPAPPGQVALDLACGRGRHVLALARAGYRTTGIDMQLDALRSAQAAARRSGLQVSLVCADLTALSLPPRCADLIVVTRYLDRPWFSGLERALRPGGVLLYETFTEQQLRHGRGPRSADHLLKPGELRQLATGLEILFDEEVTEPEAVARLAARRPTGG